MGLAYAKLARAHYRLHARNPKLLRELIKHATKEAKLADLLYIKILGGARGGRG